MTKEKILRKNFKAEFGHEGYGKFMQYILAAMEDCAVQQVKNCSIPDGVGRREQLSLSPSGCYECPKCGKSLHVSDYDHDCNYANDKN